jgi:hypothetical protein
MTPAERCDHEMKEAEDLLRAGHPDVNGLCLSIADWAAEKRIVEADYGEFITHKSQMETRSGFEPIWMPSFFFDFQAFAADWEIRKGRGALLLDTGMGKTIIQLVWAENLVRYTNKPVLIVTPAAVSFQTITEAEKFGIDARRSQDGSIPHNGIVVTNYERLHHFDPDRFAGIVCDESGILKNFNGVTKSMVTEFARRMRYRLLCTATAAPNDYTELGTHSEALGYLGYIDMLNRFFKNDQNNSAVGRQYGESVKWRFKGYAEIPYFRWVCSWALTARKPSDLGFQDGKFILPPLTETMHEVSANTLPDGMLFPVPAMDLREQREERRRTIKERCEKVAELCAAHPCSLIWCHLNPEGDLLTKLIPGAVQISGKDSDEAKEEKFKAFISGQIKKLVTKPKIGAWGFNLQHCNHQTTFPSHSYEQYYQGVRRSWRFGQEYPVTIDIVGTEGDRAVLENQLRKARQADKMFEQLTVNANRATHIDKDRVFKLQEAFPSWL